jgi:hypothetical protein
MELLVQRDPKDTKSIPGELFNGTTHIGWTLERPEVAIPAGRYQVTLWNSPHLGRVVPLLNNVPGRSMIEMHWGSFPSNSDGCILVGETQDLKDDEIFGTQDEFARIFPLIEAAVNGEGCWITVKDPQTNAEDVQDAVTAL